MSLQLSELLEKTNNLSDDAKKHNIDLRFKLYMDKEKRVFSTQETYYITAYLDDKVIGRQTQKNHNFLIWWAHGIFSAILTVKDSEKLEHLKPAKEIKLEDAVNFFDQVYLLEKDSPAWVASWERIKQELNNLKEAVKEIEKGITNEIS